MTAESGVKDYQIKLKLIQMSKIVKIYSTPVCHYCSEAKTYFKDHNIPYTEFNVKDDLVARKEMTDISGSRSVPVITIDEHYIVGWNKQDFETLFDN